MAPNPDPRIWGMSQLVSELQVISYWNQNVGGSNVVNKRDVPSETSCRGKLRLLGIVFINSTEIELKYWFWVFIWYIIVPNSRINESGSHKKHDRPHLVRNRYLEVLWLELVDVRPMVIFTLSRVFLATERVVWRIADCPFWIEYRVCTWIWKLQGKASPHIVK